MPRLFKSVNWTPTTVSWLGFVLMGLIVAGVGLGGNGYVVEFLSERFARHDLEHNRKAAEVLLPRLRAALSDPSERGRRHLQELIDLAGAFGYRAMLVDKKAGVIVYDSHSAKALPCPVEHSLLAGARTLEPGLNRVPLDTCAFMAETEAGHPLLMWMQAVDAGPDDRWLVGIGKDQGAMTANIGAVHRRLDGILFLTYLLIAGLGFFTLRLVGRIYERRLESQLQERTAQLERAHRSLLEKTRLATIGQTAAVLAHEMRNPLASIKLALSGLKGASGLGERERRRVELVVGEVDRLDGLLSETLDYVRPVRFSKQPRSLQGLVEQVLHEQAPVLAERGLRVAARLPRGLPPIPMDETQMHQVVLNVLKNAWEASPAGATLGVTLREDDGELVLEVANPGGPLPDEVRSQAFDPFFTTKPRGTGLGLGLVKRVVEAHGGGVGLLEGAGEIRLRIRLPAGHGEGRSSPPGSAGGVTPG